MPRVTYICMVDHYYNHTGTPKEVVAMTIAKRVCLFKNKPLYRLLCIIYLKSFFLLHLSTRILTITLSFFSQFRKYHFFKVKGDKGQIMKQMR